MAVQQHTAAFHHICTAAFSPSLFWLLTLTVALCHALILPPLTHAVLHQERATGETGEAVTLKAAWGVDTGTLGAEVRGGMTFIDVCGNRDI